MTAQRVLIVDDDELARRDMAARLREADYAVTETGDAQTGLDLLSRSRFHLLVLAVLMEPVDGTQILTWLESQSERPAVITLVRAHEDLPVEMGLLLGRTFAGATALQKPVDMDRFLALVEKTLRASVLSPRLATSV